MKMKFLSTVLLGMSLVALNANALTDDPHFYVQMANNSNTQVLINFIPHGDVSLTPALTTNTVLTEHSNTAAYGVVFGNIFDGSWFDVVFTGTHDCTFKLKYYAPGVPRVSMSGLGCQGGGYSLAGNSVTLYIDNINTAKK